MADNSWIGPLIGGVAKAANSYDAASKADADMQEAYRQMLANLAARMGDYDALGTAGYTDVAPQTLGPSALENAFDVSPRPRIQQLVGLASPEVQP